MKTHGWGGYPQTESTIYDFQTIPSLIELIQNKQEIIASGNNRSYGDSALSENIISIKKYNYFLDFNTDNGILHVQSGVLLSEIIHIFIPQGWFLKITPGTKLITIGGAIASDIHGKNHHIEGCFSECIDMFTLMLPSGEILTCSKKENVELFEATCGGMGLTGIILDVKIYLKKINSKNIHQITIKTSSLEDTFNAFENNTAASYSVAWIDTHAKGNAMGKGLLILGEFCDDGDLDYTPKKPINIPFYLPSFILNRYSIKIFNYLYYRKVNKKISERNVDIESFFYPLDSINNWNRVYGKDGFIQYQFILPRKTSLTGLREILHEISHSNRGSFLAVLKLYGEENNNYLSFPMEGYSLALDFKIERGIFEFLENLDKLVIKYEGRIYLAKDARTNKDVFEQGYPKINRFRKLRNKFRLNEKFNSLQSRRLGI